MILPVIIFPFYFLVAFFVFTVSCYAEPTMGDAGASDKSLMDRSIDDLMDAPIYTASKQLLPTLDAPAGVTIVTQDDIKRSGYRTLAEILNSVPGFFMSSDRIYQYIGVRGVSLAANSNARVLYMLDGIRLNDCVYDTGFVDRAFPVDVELIERVEVIRGPSSVLYGTNALFATINVITKKASKPHDVQVSAGSSADNSSSAYGYASYGYLYNRDTSFTLSGSVYRDQGRNLYFKEFDNPPSSNGEVTKEADAEDASKLYLNLRYEDFSLRAGYSEKLKHVPYPVYGSEFDNPGTKFRVASSFVDLKAEHVFPGLFQAVARVAYFDYGFDAWVKYSLNDESNRNMLIGNWWIGEVSATTEVIARNKITVGTEYRLNAKQFLSNFDESPPYTVFLDENRSSRIWALSAQDEISLHDNVILDASVRYDRYENLNGFFSPRLVLSYKVVSGTTVKLVYGTAFRAPTVVERYFDLPLSRGNLNLKPETLRSYELILEQRLPHDLLATVSGYRYKISNLIYNHFDPADGIYSFDNHGSDTVYGAEIALDGRFQEDIRWRSSYSLSKAIDDASGLRLVDSPEHLIKSNISSSLLSPKVIGNLEALYESDRLTIAGNHIGDFVTFNTTLLSTHIPCLELRLSVYNIFDKHYVNPTVHSDIVKVVEQNGRTVFAKLTYNF